MIDRLEMKIIIKLKFFFNLLITNISFNILLHNTYFVVSHFHYLLSLLHLLIFFIFFFEAKGGEHDIYSFPAERENTKMVRKIAFWGKNLYFYAFFA